MSQLIQTMDANCTMQAIFAKNAETKNCDHESCFVVTNECFTAMTNVVQAHFKDVDWWSAPGSPAASSVENARKSVLSGLHALLYRPMARADKTFFNGLHRSPIFPTSAQLVHLEDERVCYRAANTETFFQKGFVADMNLASVPNASLNIPPIGHYPGDMHEVFCGLNYPCKNTHFYNFLFQRFSGDKYYLRYEPNLDKGGMMVEPTLRFGNNTYQPYLAYQGTPTREGYRQLFETALYAAGMWAHEPHHGINNDEDGSSDVDPIKNFVHKHTGCPTSKPCDNDRLSIYGQHMLAKAALLAGAWRHFAYYQRPDLPQTCTTDTECGGDGTNGISCYEGKCVKKIISECWGTIAGEMIELCHEARRKVNLFGVSTSAATCDDVGVDDLENFIAQFTEPGAVQPDYCSYPARCGNGQVDPGEDCDDGNKLWFDHCNNRCEVNLLPTDTPCGDGIQQDLPGYWEECDNGGNNGFDGVCDENCRLVVSVCGNGVRDIDELCDDGNTVNGDGCESNCEYTPLPPGCPDGIVQAGEECDDNNIIDGDGCEHNCFKTPFFKTELDCEQHTPLGPNNASFDITSNTAAIEPSLCSSLIASPAQVLAEIDEHEGPNASITMNAAGGMVTTFTSVNAGTFASNVGLKTGDVLTHLNNASFSLTSAAELASSPANLESITVSRPLVGGGTQSVTILLEEQGGGCASSSVAEQPFTLGMVGCAGTVTWANRGNLCKEGWHVCSAEEYYERNFSTNVRTDAPIYNYWTDDDLRYSGSASGNCSVSLTSGSTCSSPMRVCTSAGSDSLGNNCNWERCGYNGSTSNHYFGGCAGNTTAGTLCCK
ncbi:DUF4215 domain-containing protein [Polyangium aurulentum]|uniref:DUF4215 domain-containing protein n=1 Tax=Polyangium aurulentum TaxID=2567896 RepID=UPI00146E3BA2|nr:DUF4215 domain-containing protein [Polyangium aurulentum]UQA60474.1 DUF4215 domain-containing protein [Polyangium aurulentum]